jgi:hypothetical protein
MHIATHHASRLARTGAALGARRARAQHRPLHTSMGAGSRQVALKQCTVLPGVCLYSSRSAPSCRPQQHSIANNTGQSRAHNSDGCRTGHSRQGVRPACCHSPAPAGDPPESAASRRRWRTQPSHAAPQLRAPAAVPGAAPGPAAPQRRPPLARLPSDRRPPPAAQPG